MEDIFEIAKNMEKEGWELYEEQVKKTTDEGIKNILHMLAQQEKEHYNIFDALQKKHSIKLKQGSFKGITDFFKEAREDLPKDQLDVYKKILSVEKKSQEFYEEIAQKQDNPQTKEIIQRIAHEEHKHWIIIKNMIDYIKRPEQWVEDAEFHHLEDY